MSLQDKLKEETFRDLKKIRLSGIGFYEDISIRLKSLYNQNKIDDSSVENALEVAVLNQARLDYEFMTNENRIYNSYPDKLGRTDCFVYALLKNEFSAEEIEKIPFDHGDTLYTYVQEYYKEDLISSIREEILHQKSSNKPILSIVK